MLFLLCQMSNIGILRCIKPGRKILPNCDVLWSSLPSNKMAFAIKNQDEFWLLNNTSSIFCYLSKYMEKLYSSFNPCSVDGLMCRSLVSVSWDGYLYDCDFNLARGLFMGGHKIHVSEMSGPPPPNSHIVTADHCYTCTAGSGFTWGGSIEAWVQDNPMISWK